MLPPTAGRGLCPGPPAESTGRQAQPCLRRQTPRTEGSVRESALVTSRRGLTATQTGQGARTDLCPPAQPQQIPSDATHACRTACKRGEKGDQQVSFRRRGGGSNPNPESVSTRRAVPRLTPRGSHCRLAKRRHVCSPLHAQDSSCCSLSQNGTHFPSLHLPRSRHTVSSSAFPGGGHSLLFPGSTQDPRVTHC